VNALIALVDPTPASSAVARAVLSIYFARRRTRGQILAASIVGDQTALRERCLERDELARLVMSLLARDARGGVA
jgi:hypothetical protein